MAHEIEAAGLDSVRAVLGRKPGHALLIGAPCPNCATPLAGPWCHACGQSSDDFHRSIVRLGVEAIGGLWDLDSRLWRTLPRLCIQPARLTRDFLDGHRMAQVPPFRLFLVVVVLVFLVTGLGPPGKTKVNIVTPQAVVLTDKGVAIDMNREVNDPGARWLTSRMTAVSKHPEAFEAAMLTWAQRLAILALPISALLLAAMFFWRRGVFLYDHLIFSMHSLSFQGLLISAITLGSMASGWFALLILVSPAHLFVHLKGTYGLGVFGTLIRMGLLLFGSLVGFMALMTGIVLIGLYEVSA